MPLPGTQTAYMSKLASSIGDTFCFDFSNEPSFDDGATLSSPTITESPSGVLVLGTPEVTGEDFKSTDGRTVPAGRGIKVRVLPGTALSGKFFVLTCKALLNGDEKVREGRIGIV